MSTRWSGCGLESQDSIIHSVNPEYCLWAPCWTLGTRCEVKATVTAPVEPTIHWEMSLQKQGPVAGEGTPGRKYRVRRGSEGGATWEGSEGGATLEGCCAGFSTPRLWALEILPLPSEKVSNIFWGL